MRKVLFLLGGIVIFSIFVSLESCKKQDLNPEYSFTIVCKTLADSIPVQGVFVEIGAPVPGSSDKFEDMYGITDINGEVEFKYDNDATLRIQATRGTKPNYSWIGCNYVRLEPNTNVVQTVYIKPSDGKAEGCFAP